MSEAGWSEVDDRGAWDDFVTRNGGSVFHLWQWRQVIESAELKPLYLAYRDEDGTMLAVCPFFRRAGRYLHYLDSLPDSHMGGPVVSGREEDVSTAMQSLRKHVRFSPFKPVIALRVNVHQPKILEPLLRLGIGGAITHELIISNLREKTPEHVWKNGFQKHDRQAVKYYEQQGWEFKFAAEDEDYSAYVNARRGLSAAKGTRVDFLSRMRRHVGDRLKVGLVMKEGRAIAGFSMLCDPENSIVHVAGNYEVRYLREKNIHSPVTFLYWKAINWASAQGFRDFDFGAYPLRKSSDPTHAFYKLRMKFEASNVPRYLFVMPTSDLPYSLANRISRML